MARHRAGELRRAIEGLPLATRRSMLQGIQENNIVVGADGNMRGGVCPMFAATARSSRSKGRNFARAWDRYAGVRLPRPATEREVRALRSMLETSIDRQLQPAEAPTDLAAAIAAHEAAVARTRAELAAAERDEAERREAQVGVPLPSRARTSRERPQVDTGERDRTSELGRRHGWSWLRPVRTLGEYESALLEMEEAERERLEQYKEREPVPAGRD
jgi:hypothetical protein